MASDDFEGPRRLTRSIERTTAAVDRLVRAIGPSLCVGPPRDRLAWLFSALDSDDLVLETVHCGSRGIPVDVVYIRSIVDEPRLTTAVLAPLKWSAMADPRAGLPHAVREADGAKILDRLLRGWVAAFREGIPGAFLTPARLRKGRAVAESTTEPELVAAKDSFVEDLDTNINLVRFRLSTPRLTVKFARVGRLAQGRIAFVYVRGVADPALASSIAQRLRDARRADYVPSGLRLAQLAFATTWSPFPQVQETERPDTVARALATGRVCLLVDGSPFAMLYPATMNELDKRREVDYMPPPTAMFIRWLRYAGLLLSLSAPAIYVAVMAVSPQLLSPDLLVAIAATREGVPYPVLLETLLMLATLDVVTEAALHAPAAIGQTLTIVGSLIVGQAAVTAKMASSMMIIVLAVTSIGNLLAANLPLSYAFRIVKYPMVIATNFLGMYGLSLSFIVLVTHLVSLRSMGTPFMAPLGPIHARDLLRHGPIVAPSFHGKHDGAVRPAGAARRQGSS